MPDNTNQIQIEQWLVELRLPSIKRNFIATARTVAEQGGDYLAFLHALLNEEVDSRRARKIQRRIKEARFPQLRRLSDLDGAELPAGISLDLLNELARGGYIDEGGNIIAVGPSGTGKSHVCDALGLAACEQGRRVRRYTATSLVCELEEAQEKKELHRYLRRFGAHDLVVVDELGYMPISENGGDLFFQALSERHERKSVVLNTNLPFGEWTQIFRTERLTVALLDRLTHRAQILEMNGKSYRLKSAMDRQAQGGAAQD